MALPFIINGGGKPCRYASEKTRYPNAAGIDIGASSHWVAVPQQLADAAGKVHVREVGAMTDDLVGLARWLVALGADTLALESTGVCWMPVFEVLEEHGLKVWLVDARTNEIRAGPQQ